MQALVRWISSLAISNPIRALVCAGLLAALALPGALRLSVSAEVYKLIPHVTPSAEGLALAAEGLSHSSTVFGLLEIPADQPADPERLLALAGPLAEALQASEFVDAARYRPADGLPATDPYLLFDLIEQPEELAPLRDRLSEDGLKRRARFLKELLSGPAGAVGRQLLLRDPFGLLDLLGEQVARGIRRMDAGGNGFVSADGRGLVLMLVPSEPGSLSSRDFNQRLYTDISARGAAQLAADPSGAGLRLRYTGAPMHARVIETATRADATLLSVISLIAVLGLYLGFYRSFHSLGLIFALLPLSVLVALGVAGWSGIELTPLAAGFAAIIFGLGIDPAIHLISRYREARRALAPVDAAHAAIEGVGSAVLVAAMTTSGALFSLAIVEEGAVGQVGFLAGIGVLVNSLIMLTVLPACWILLGERLGPDAGIGVGGAHAFASLLYRRAPLLLLVVLSLSLALGSQLPKLRYSASLAGFQPSSLEPVQVDTAMQEHFGVERGKMLIVLAGDDEQAVLASNDLWRSLLARAKKEGRIWSYETLATLKPAESTRLRRHDLLRERVDVAAAVERMRGALRGEGFRLEPFEPALSKLEAFAAGEITSTSHDPEWLAWFEQRHLGRVDGELRLVSELFPSNGALPLAEWLREQAPAAPTGVVQHVTGQALFETEMAALLGKEIAPAVGGSLLALLAVLIAYYRRPKLVALAFLPLCLAVILFFALHGALNREITLFSLISIPLLLGVGIDDHLFMLDRYLEGGHPGRLDEAIAGAGRAILVTTLTTLAAFGVLSLSRFDALASLGTSVVFALGLAFLSSVVLLPALLALFLPGEDAEPTP